MSRYLESLENRTLFAAAPAVATATLVGTNVSVVGTKKADDIHVQLSADLASVEVLHNGAAVGSFPLSSITLGLGFGVVVSNACSVQISSPASTIGQELFTPSGATAGTYCVQVSDQGTVTENVTYTITVKHY